VNGRAIEGTHADDRRPRGDPAGARRCAWRARRAARGSAPRARVAGSHRSGL